jgi:hypothetical protein
LVSQGGNTAFMTWVSPPTTWFIKDEKTSGTNGGGFSNGAWRTRVLNTLTSTSSDVSVTLSSNQLIIEPGVYIINIVCPAYDVNSHAARLFNVTDNVSSISGSSSYSSIATGLAVGGGVSVTVSIIKGVINISSQKTFRVEHICTKSNTGDGFGIATGLATEVYTQVTITQVN